MTIEQFIDEVISTKEISTVTTKADVQRIVANTPINWDEQEFTQEEVTDELWYNWCNKARYVFVLTDAQVKEAKGDFVEYMQVHNCCTWGTMHEAIEKVAFDYANSHDGVTYVQLYEILEAYYRYLEENEPNQLVPDL